MTTTLLQNPKKSPMGTI